MGENTRLYVPLRVRSKAGYHDAGISVNIRALAAALVVAVGIAAPAAGQPGAPAPRTIVCAGDENFAPYECRDENGRPAGFNIALMQAVAVRANVALAIRLMPWKSVMSALDRRETDLVNLAYSDARAARYALLPQIWTLQQAVLFGPDVSRTPIGWTSSRTRPSRSRIDRSFHELLASLPEVDRPTLVTKASQADALGELLAGRASAVAGNDLS